MDEYISRQALIDDFTNDLLCCQFGSALKGTPRSEIEIKNVLERIEDFPAEDVAPVVHGRWVGTQYDGYADGYPVYDTWECSVCHSDEYESEGDPPAFAYCSNCGAKMDMEG